MRVKLGDFLIRMSTRGEKALEGSSFIHILVGQVNPDNSRVLNLL